MYLKVERNKFSTLLLGKFYKANRIYFSMKVPKEMKRYCPKCTSHTTQKVKIDKGKGRNKAHPLSKYSRTRLAARRIGQGFGTGNSGRLSRGSQNSWKRQNKKHSKKIDFRYTCSVCKKMNLSGDKGPRTKKMQVV